MTPQNLLEAEARHLVQTYLRRPAIFTHGEGVHLFDREGKRYLDFAAGIAVNALGYSDPEWIAAVQDQAGKLIHLSNLFHTVPHVELAERLTQASFAERVFFSNSGAEANEAAIKFARKWARSRGGIEKTELVAFDGGFHGRTLGALSLTHKAAYRDPFSPLVPGVIFAPFNDPQQAEQAITERTCAVIVEPVQGEGGVRPADPAFLRALRARCDQQQALLIFDEVQCGLGRTGHLWAHQAYHVTPDIMTLAKPLAGGLPIGATLVTEEVAQTLEVGDHGSTFGAGPLVCRAALVVLARIAQPGMLREVREKGEALAASLRALPETRIVDVRGAGLLVGVEFKRPVHALVEAAFERGLIVINAGENVLRICPPLIITPQELAAGLEILEACLSSLETEEGGGPG